MKTLKPHPERLLICPPPPVVRLTCMFVRHGLPTAKRLVNLLKANNPGHRSDGLHLTREGQVDSKGGSVCIFAGEQDVFRYLQQQGMWLYLCWGSHHCCSQSVTMVRLEPEEAFIALVQEPYTQGGQARHCPSGAVCFQQDSSDGSRNRSAWLVPGTHGFGHCHCLCNLVNTILFQHICLEMG